jgi:anti-anti-sigma factor
MFCKNGYLADFTMLINDGVPLVSVKGAIDENNIFAFKAVMECAETTGAAAIIVMLRTTEYVCAHGYGILGAAYGRLAAANRRLYVVCDRHGYPRRMVTLLELPFPVFDNLEGALAAVRRGNLRSTK